MSLVGAVARYNDAIEAVFRANLDHKTERHNDAATVMSLQILRLKWTAAAETLIDARCGLMAVIDQEFLAIRAGIIAGNCAEDDE